MPGPKITPAAALAAWKALENAFACQCVGPQNGQPFCPCRMRNIEVRDGRYIETIDHGPVADGDDIIIPLPASIR